MNPVLKCDGERRALLLSYDQTTSSGSQSTTSSFPEKVGYGSIAAKEWLLQGEDKILNTHDTSEASSTCCSSSDDEEQAIGEPVFSQSIRFSDRPVIVVLPDQDELPSDEIGKQKHDSSHILKHQNTSLAASTCAATTYGAYDTDECYSDLEAGGWNVSESSNVRGRCGVGRGLTMPGWEAYNKSLDEKPVATKAFTSLTGWFIGDLVTQTIITGGPFDIHRSIVLASFGFFFHGPAGHVIYDNLDRIIEGTGPREIALKIAFDQVLWCPVFMVCYFTYLGLANGDSPMSIVEKIHSDLWTAVQGSWKVWVLAHAIQFRYVKTKHRIVYINCIEVCFIMFLSFLGNR